jgi:16S rRNA G966 N2-methylase RsmD
MSALPQNGGKNTNKITNNTTNKNTGHTQHKSTEYISVGRIANKLDSDTVYTLKDLDLDNSYKKAVFNLFPKVDGINRSLLKINKVGLYSMTKPNDAKKMIDIITEYVEPINSIMINATSGIGGEILNMYSKFKYIYAYELNKTQFDLLKHNLQIYDVKNVDLINDDFTKHLNDHLETGQKNNKSVVIIDPPWGGLDYKKETSLNLKLGDFTMSDLATRIDADLIVLKLPANHDLTEFNKFNHRVYNVINYLLVVINKKINN